MHAACIAWFAATALPLMGMRIVLTNDDGFESANTQALFVALRNAGHQVILSAPYRNVSGTAAQLGGLTDVPPTSLPSPGGSLAAGVPGIGPTKIAADQYYVDSTPIAAVLYGIDIAAPTKWSGGPDLVISGPNVGNNLGGGLTHSGTVGAAIMALNRGLPAIAVSGANGEAASAPMLAEIILRLVAALEVHGQVGLPPGTGLNVNVPALDLKRTAASYRFAFTQVGPGATPSFRFSVHAGDAPLAAAPIPPVDRNPGSEVNAFADRNTVTVSPIQGTFQAAPEESAAVLTQLRGLVSSAMAIPNPKLINVSARCFVGVGNAVQIVGFDLSGASPKTVLIRASGPALALLGLAGSLADPKAELYNSDSRLVARNDNWSEDEADARAIAAAAARVGAFAWESGSKDAAMIVNLPPGSYTVVVRGAAETMGVALIEVYDLGSN